MDTNARRFMLIARDGGIYRDANGDPIRSYDLSELRARARSDNLSDWQIINDNVPWIAKVAADAEGCTCASSIYCRKHD